jgi:DNA primase
VMENRGVNFRHAVELSKADPSLAAGQAGEVKCTTVRSLPAPVTDLPAVGLLNP